MSATNRFDLQKKPIEQFKNELNEVVQHFFNEPFFSAPSASLFNKADVLTPAMNIEETDKLYRITVEIPGVNPEDVDIELDGNVMSIKGEKSHKEEKEDKDARMHVVEHSYGSFYRSFTLPENVDSSDISAENKNGMLYIEVPKSKKSEPHRIEVKKLNK